MTVFVVIIIAGIALVIFGAKKGRDKKNQMAERGALSYFTATHVEGLGISSNAICDIMQFSDKIQIESGNSKFQIPLENIRAAAVKNERELTEKGKSVVGRAVIGTLLVPGLGTIIGGMSGIGSKKKKGPLKTFFILNYTNSKGDMDAVTFLNNLNDMKIHKVCTSINASISVHTSTDGVIQL